MKVAIGVALVMGAIVLAATVDEIHREATDVSQWTRDLEAPDPDRRADALDRYSLAREPWPQPVPCAALSRRLGDSVVRAQARAALARVVAAGDCVTSVAALLDSSNEVPSLAVAARVLAFAPIAWHSRVIPSLIRTSERGDSSGLAAVAALGQLGDSATAARVAVERASTSEDQSKRAEAVEAIARIGSGAEVAVVIERALRDSSADVRAAGVNALASRGDAVRPKSELVARLQPLLLDSSPSVRAAAKQALRLLGVARVN